MTKVGEAKSRVGNILVRNVGVEFQSGIQSVFALHDISLEVVAGEFVAILGPSGCGKSTLLNAIAGFIRPTAGEILLDGKLIVGAAADRGVVFQQPALFPWKTVLGNIALGPRMSGHSRSQAEAIARTFMEMVGLIAFAKHYPETLSGGMQQRVGIARALANRPSVLLMDEPFGALDAQTRELMQEHLLRVWEELKTTLVFVTHDIDEAIFLADRIVLMSARPGRILTGIAVRIPRPRNSDALMSREFVDIKRRCRELIRTESIKAFEQQNNVNM